MKLGYSEWGKVATRTKETKAVVAGTRHVFEKRVLAGKGYKNNKIKHKVYF
jgi:hypothetical protein